MRWFKPNKPLGHITIGREGKSFLVLVVLFRRNDICTTILQQLSDNFLSHTHIMFLSSLFLFLSLLFLTNRNRGKWRCLESCHQWLFIYHCSFLVPFGRWSFVVCWDFFGQHLMCFFSLYIRTFNIPKKSWKIKKKLY